MCSQKSLGRRHHATLFPDKLGGIWSASDHYSEGADELQSEQASCPCLGCCGGVAIFNSWTHTTPLWGAVSLLGAEFTADGVIVRPSGVDVGSGTRTPQFNISAPVLGVHTEARGGYGGHYQPQVNEGSCSVRIELSAADQNALKTLEVNGIKQSAQPADGAVTIRLAACSVRWSLTR